MIKTVAELNALREKKEKELYLRLGKDRQAWEEQRRETGCRMQILICGVAGCLSSGSLKVADRLEQWIQENGMSREVNVIKTGCMGLCAEGPLMVVYPGRVMYTHVQPEDVEEIFEIFFADSK